MKLLAIDTSTDLATVAVSIGNEIIEEEKLGTREHAQVLLTMIDSLLSSAAISINQLDGIVFGRGPGSFTGLRITCSIAKALGYAHDLPLYPVSSLASIATEVYINDPAYKNSQVLAVMDARMQELYWGVYNKGIGSVEESVCAPANIVVSEDLPTILAGVGFESYTALFSPQVSAKIYKSHVIYPHAKTMLRLVQSGSIEAVSAENAQPIYVRNQVTQGVPRGKKIVGDIGLSFMQREIAIKKGGAYMQIR